MKSDFLLHLLASEYTEDKLCLDLVSKNAGMVPMVKPTALIDP